MIVDRIENFETIFNIHRQFIFRIFSLFLGICFKAFLNLNFKGRYLNFWKVLNTFRAFMAHHHDSWIYTLKLSKIVDNFQFCQITTYLFRGSNEPLTSDSLYFLWIPIKYKSRWTSLTQKSPRRHRNLSTHKQKCNYLMT